MLTINIASLDDVFSLPREPMTSLAPGQHHALEVPGGKKVLITDIHIENLGDGPSYFGILKQRGPNSFEIRYRFRTAAQGTTIINFTTGLRLGDEVPIAGSIRIDNSEDSEASILARVNGTLS